jgi:hypothetical protein
MDAGFVEGDPTSLHDLRDQWCPVGTQKPIFMCIYCVCMCLIRMNVCMYTYLCMCICTQTHTHTHPHTHTHTHTRTHAHTHTHIMPAPCERRGSHCDRNALLHCLHQGFFLKKGQCPSIFPMKRQYVWECVPGA